MSSQKAFSKLQIKPNTTQLDMNTPKNRQTSDEPPWTVAWSLPLLFHPFLWIRDKFFFISEVQGNEKGSRLWNSGRDRSLGWLVEVGWSPPQCHHCKKFLALLGDWENHRHPRKKGLMGWHYFLGGGNLKLPWWLVGWGWLLPKWLGTTELDSF